MRHAAHDANELVLSTLTLLDAFENMFTLVLVSQFFLIFELLYSISTSSDRLPELEFSVLSMTFCEIKKDRIVLYETFRFWCFLHGQ